MTHDHGAPSAGRSAARAYLVVGAILLAWTAAHLAVVGALLQALVPGGWWTVLGVGVLLVVATFVMLDGFRTRRAPGKWARLLVMRPFWYAQMALFPASITGALLWLLGLPFGRALAWGRAGALTMLVLLALLYVAGYFGSRRLVVERIELTFRDLPPGFDGVTIAQLSDLHVGPHTPAGFLRRVVRAVEDAKPDLVAFTGDQIDDFPTDADRFADVFGHLRAPLGVYAIVGNHDVYAGWDDVRPRLERAGLRILLNEAVPLRRGGDEVWLVGTGDPAGLQTLGGGRPDLAPDIPRSLEAVPAGAFAVALAHNPALWPALAERGVRVTLSGHTHHGQLSIPPLGWSLASPFLELAMGRHLRGASVLYINPGTNYWGLPLRLGAWPEVTLVTLKKG